MRLGTTGLPALSGRASVLTSARGSTHTAARRSTHTSVWAMIRAVFLVLLTLCGVGPAGALECDDPAQLQFALIPQANGEQGVEALRPLLAELERETGKKVRAIVPNSYNAVVEGLLAESVDIAMLGPASYAKAKDSGAGVQVFANYSTRGGAFQTEGPFYRSLLIVRKDSKFGTVEALKGKTLGLVDPLSTSGTILPRDLLGATLGMPFERYFGRIVYSGAHDKSAMAVLEGRVDAAFVATFLLSEVIRQGGARADDFRVLWRSEPIPLDPFVYRSRLCAPLKEKIRKVFFSKNGEAFPSALHWMNAVRISPIAEENYRTIRQIMQRQAK